MINQSQTEEPAIGTQEQYLAMYLEKSEGELIWQSILCLTREEAEIELEESKVTMNPLAKHSFIAVIQVPIVKS